MVDRGEQRGVFAQTRCTVGRILLGSLLASPLAAGADNPSVVLSVPTALCGQTACQQPPCVRSQWVDAGVLRVEATVMHGATSEVVPQSATVAVEDRVVQLGYGLRNRTYDQRPGSPPRPACLVAVPLVFAVSGLARADYQVRLTEDRLYALWPTFAAVAAGLAALVAGVVVYRLVKRRQLRSLGGA